MCTCSAAFIHCYKSGEWIKSPTSNHNPRSKRPVQINMYNKKNIDCLYLTLESSEFALKPANRF